jgi:hypothetical protein
MVTDEFYTVAIMSSMGPLFLSLLTDSTNAIVVKTLSFGVDTSPPPRIRSLLTSRSTVVKVRPRFFQTEDGFHERLLISFRCECLGERCLFEYFIWKVGYIVCCDDALMMHLLSSTNNRNILEETDDKFYFPPGSLLYNQDNIITILQVSSTLYFITRLQLD